MVTTTYMILTLIILKVLLIDCPCERQVYTSMTSMRQSNFPLLQM